MKYSIIFIAIFLCLILNQFQEVCANDSSDIPKNINPTLSTKYLVIIFIGLVFVVALFIGFIYYCKKSEENNESNLYSEWNERKFQRHIEHQQHQNIMNNNNNSANTAAIV
ncbi:putative mediator complex subunit 7 [Tieghemostelium lacteum]|uniref:Putative mediator complex subunit 7 n=1 Tax=Tieghemostelium lacteum TaxID=361077 RepID=A0A151Z5L5_TIELA|nr:putative mediator complex subunit 7 [Tieghemostelium lacteum]|eukprot:KYQ89259.1 putative mediator complex subunit 7 [Tieghemostelium lacteum]